MTVTTGYTEGHRKKRKLFQPIGNITLLFSPFYTAFLTLALKRNPAATVEIYLDQTWAMAVQN